MRSKKRRKHTEAWLRSKEGLEYQRGMRERPEEEAAEVKRFLNDLNERPKQPKDSK